MQSYIATTSEPIKPIDPGQFKDTGWGQTVFFTIAAPIVLLCVQKLWERIQHKDKREDKKQDSEISRVEAIVKADLQNKNDLFTEFQKQYNVLLQEIIGRNDEALKDIQATLSTTVGVLATLAENQKSYADIALKRSDETRLILDEIRRASSHTVLESMNSHVKITRISLDNQKQIIAMLHELNAISRKLHERLDVIYGDSRS